MWVSILLDPQDPIPRLWPSEDYLTQTIPCPFPSILWDGIVYTKALESKWQAIFHTARDQRVSSRPLASTGLPASQETTTNLQGFLRSQTFSKTLNSSRESVLSSGNFYSVSFWDPALQGF